MLRLGAGMTETSSEPLSAILYSERLEPYEMPEDRRESLTGALERHLALHGELKVRRWLSWCLRTCRSRNPGAPQLAAALMILEGPDEG